ncbi:MAG: transketolase [Elusimicrobiales bacterium]|nr:transketolase [Elusimicrobiales bacterium]
MTDIDLKSADAIRVLSIDAVTNAKSGHPGMPLGASTIIYTIFKYYLRFDPSDPKWIFRDRFVLSSGHASAMLYSTLHLFGYDLKIEELKAFRKIGSITPGHPEYGHTSGVEATTGPLGQGIGMAVGMAWAERYLAKNFNKSDCSIFNGRIFALCGDGDMMEGISYEAGSLAGHLGLGNLVLVYDSNNITIEGKTDLAFSEDVGMRFKAFGWNVISVDDGFDIDKIRKGLDSSVTQNERPSLVIVKTKIGYKSPKEGSNKVHGEPLSDEEVDETRKSLGWEYKERFYVPDDIRKNFMTVVEEKKKQRKDYDKRLDYYRSSYPSDYERMMRWLEERFDIGDIDLKDLKPLATREYSHIIINELSKSVENIVSGSADLAPSTKTNIVSDEKKNIHFGIREHAMGAFVNGVSLYGMIKPFCSTFLVFSDYMRPSIRLAALMNISPVFIFTHDSIAVGEDGPTHEPVEHIMSLRLIPNLYVIRPAGFYETLMAFKFALKSKKPVALILTRQKVSPLVEYKDITVKNFSYGAYNVIEHSSPDMIIAATGSEIDLAISVSKELLNENIKANVVSLPSVEMMKESGENYIRKLFPLNVKKFFIEAGRTCGWSDIIGDMVYSFGVDNFGYSGNEKDVYKKFGLTVADIKSKIKEIING